jgi:protein TonB
MFEDSVLKSEGGRRKTWIALGSVVAQAALIAALVVVPLMNPERLPAMPKVSRLKELTLVKPPTPPRPVVVRVTNELARSAPASAAPAVAQARGPIITLTPSNNSDAPVLLPVGTGMAAAFSFPGGIGTGPATATGPAVTVKPGSGGNGSRPLPVSTGVMSGRLLAPIQPRYPQIAIAAHQEGTVVVTATIDCNGRIVNLQVVSGPALLRAAAAEAIKEARYRPYLLNGQATEVMTTIAVNFKMSGG